CFGQASCSGLAFNITYTVQSAVGTTPINYPKAAGCTSSTADPTDCVLVFDSIGNILVETIQTGTYGVVTKDNTSTSVACSPGSIVPTGVSTCTATVTDTTTASNTPTGTVSFTSSNTAVGTVGASCILSSGKCSVAFTGVAAGTATVTGTYGGHSTHNVSQGTSGTISGTNAGSGSVIAGYGGDATHNTSISSAATVIVNATPPLFDYSLSNNGPVSIVQGSSGTVTVTATLTAGTAVPVTLSCVTPLPTGVGCSFATSSNPVTPTGSSVLTISTSASTPTGPFTLMVTGSPLGATTTPTSVA